MSDEIIEGVNPTRMELLKIKSRIALAEKGHRLLRERRDALIMEFMSLSRNANEVVEETVRQLDSASRHLKIADSLAGPSAVDSASLAASDSDLEVDVDYKNVVGVRIPQLSRPNLIRNLRERNMGLISTHPMVSRAAEEHERAFGKLLELMEAESSLRALATETRRTKRRVNALEYAVIPKLKNTQKHIRLRLDELGMEDFYRLKMFKKRMEVE
jgi:V/A-type H+-transporting ATPase subunit D